MGSPMYKVGEVARAAGTTVRALHHYEEIGLLRPSGRSSRGYRLYSEDDLLRLQQIYVGRTLGLSLEEIRRVLDDPSIDREQALLQQRQKLVARLDETHKMISALDAALRTLSTETKGEGKMNPKELFDGFDPSEYEEEAQRRWGDTDAYQEASKRTSTYTENDWARMRAGQDALMAEVVAAMEAGAASEDPAVLDLAERHRLHIDQWFYPCSRAMHAALADMYQADERFEASFEEYGKGLTAYLVRAIRANASRT